MIDKPMELRVLLLPPKINADMAPHQDFPNLDQWLGFWIAGAVNLELG